MMSVMTMIFCLTISKSSRNTTKVLLGVTPSLFAMFMISTPEPTLSHLTILVDNLALTLEILTVWLILMILAQPLKKTNKPTTYLTTLLALLLSLALFFFSDKMINFYIFFETSLIPTLFLILSWGYQPERLKAGSFLMIYTIFASLPLLMIILTSTRLLSSESLFSSLLKQPNPQTNLIILLPITAAFFTKLPIYGLHLWLPKAHVEAPVAGSMLLAGVLLKMGGFGLLRWLPLTLKSATQNSTLINSWVLLGGLSAGLICMKQLDYKTLIAYSSITHMAMVAACSLTLTMSSTKMILLLMLAHGLSSSGLFFLANSNYSRFNSRSLLLNKGLISLSPILTLNWFLLCSSNMAAPPTLNLLSEIGLIHVLLSWDSLTALLISLTSFITAAYSLYLYSAITQNSPSLQKTKLFCAKTQESSISLFHWIPLNLLIITPEILL